MFTPAASLQALLLLLLLLRPGYGPSLMGLARNQQVKHQLQDRASCKTRAAHSVQHQSLISMWLSRAGCPQAEPVCRRRGVRAAGEAPVAGPSQQCSLTACDCDDQAQLSQCVCLQAA